MVSSQWRGDEVGSSDDESSKDGSYIGNRQCNSIPSSLPKTFLGVLISHHQNSQPSNPPTTIKTYRNNTISANINDGTPKRPTTRNVDNDNKQTKSPLCWMIALPLHGDQLKQSRESLMSWKMIHRTLICISGHTHIQTLIKLTSNKSYKNMPEINSSPVSSVKM